MRAMNTLNLFANAYKHGMYVDTTIFSKDKSEHIGQDRLRVKEFTAFVNGEIIIQLTWPSYDLNEFITERWLLRMPAGKSIDLATSDLLDISDRVIIPRRLCELDGLDSEKLMQDMWFKVFNDGFQITCQTANHISLPVSFEGYNFQKKLCLPPFLVGALFKRLTLSNGVT